jgi:hypothetical protein
MSANAIHFFEQSTVSQHCAAKFNPILPTTARYHVVYSGKGKLLMVEVTMKHEKNLVLQIAKND